MNSVENLGGQIAGAFDSEFGNPAFNVTANGVNGAAASGVNMGGVTIQVYGAPGQDENTIAQKVADIINNQVYRSGAVFA